MNDATFKILIPLNIILWLGVVVAVIRAKIEIDREIAALTKPALSEAKSDENS